MGQKRTPRGPKRDRERTEEQRAKEFRKRDGERQRQVLGSRGQDDVREGEEDAERGKEQWKERETEIDR